MSDSNRVQMAFIKEVTYGVTPSGALQVTRYTGEGFAQTTRQSSSSEIQAGRQITDIVRMSANAEGDLSFELSCTTFDDFILAALEAASFTAVTTVMNAATTVSAAATDNSFNTTGTWAVTPTVNQWIKVSGFATATNNGYFKVVSATTTKIVVTSGPALTLEAATPAITIKQGGQAVNGVTVTSFSWEKAYTDLTNVFTAYPGCVVDTMSLDIQAEQRITGTFRFVGQQEQSKTATIGTSYTAATTTDSLSAVDDIKLIAEGGAVYASTGFSLALNNNIRKRMQIGSVGPTSMGAGSCVITGAIRAYFSTSAVMDKYLNDTWTSLAIAFQDLAGNAYVMDLPRVKYTAGKRVAGGQNTDIIADMSWSAAKHPTEGITIRISKWP